ncbi:MAG: peptide chain release factor 1 [Christensenellales bacterium]|jgi:peptide chain release factor 1
MFDKLEKLKQRYDEISALIADPEVISDQNRYKTLLKEHSDLSDAATAHDEYNRLKEELTSLEEMLSDPELKELAETEIGDLSEQIKLCEDNIRRILTPKDPNDAKNVILEIRAGTGGDEASLFAANLLRMYGRYAERHRFKIETLSSNITELNGVKEIAVSIQGKGAYSRLKYESGVHRVQRVPETESQGRIHTSAATVAVLPEAEDVDVQINPNDLRVDVFRSGGHGGQSVNTTDSAVRITHLPTGLVVTCQDEKSQLKNKEKAMRVLKSRLLDMMQSQKEQEYAEHRRSQIGSGDRSERIRTYNFPQNRVTDHRIGLTLYKLDAFIDGDLDEMIDALTLASEEAARE